MKTLLLVAFLTVTGLGVNLAQAASPIPAAHKALYKMSLESSKSTSVVDIRGQMYYDFTDTCDAWNTDQKFALDYVYAEEPESKLNSQYSSQESKNFSTYDFAVKRLKDGDVQEEYVGSSTRKPDGTGSVTYTQPAAKQMDLPKGFLFPTQHTMQIIAEAQAGKHIFNAEMFDGSDGEGALEVNVIVGDVIKPDVDAKLADNDLLKSPARKVRLAFYEAETAKKTSQTAEPDYEMTMVLHENGVVSSMRIDYNEFSLKGELQAIEAAPPPKC